MRQSGPLPLLVLFSFCDTRPAEEEAKKRRRPRNKKTKTAADTETEKDQPTTKQSDHRDPAECQGYFQKTSAPPVPAAEQSAPGHPTLDATPEDNATTMTTADLSPSTSPLASLVSLSLV